MAKPEATKTPAASITDQVANLPAAEPVQAPQDLPSKLPATARVRSRVGDMRHLLTDVLVTDVERKMDIDSFAEVQIRAGKWEIVRD